MFQNDSLNLLPYKPPTASKVLLYGELNSTTGAISINNPVQSIGSTYLPTVYQVYSNTAVNFNTRVTTTAIPANTWTNVVLKANENHDFIEFVTTPANTTWSSGGASYQATIYANNIFAGAAAYSTNAGYSTDGITWTTTTMPVSAGWFQMTYGNGYFVSLGTGSTTAAISQDAITWTPATLPTSSAWISVTYGNGIFFGLSYGSPFTTATSSTDGITWTLRALPSPPSGAQWYNVAYGNGIFVITSAVATGAASSTDGITWTTRTLPALISWSGISYGNNTFVAIGSASGGANTTAAASSTDGLTWNLRTMPVSAAWTYITYGNGTFMVVTQSSTTAASSTNGITWTLRTQANFGTNGITYGKGSFIASPGYAKPTSPTSPILVSVYKSGEAVY